MAKIYSIAGRLIDPLDLQRADIDAAAAIHALSILNRYGGHTIQPYSVAEHTVHLANAVPERLRRAAVLHEFAEGLGFVDMVNPVKREFPAYEERELQALRRIFAHFDEPWENLAELTPYDRSICADEMLQVFPEPYVSPTLKPLGNVEVEFWTWKQARDRLIALAVQVNVL